MKEFFKKIGEHLKKLRHAAVFSWYGIKSLFLGPSFSTPCSLVLQIPVLRFCRPDIWSLIFRRCIFRPWSLLVTHFPFLHFPSNHSQQIHNKSNQSSLCRNVSPHQWTYTHFHLVASTRLIGKRNFACSHAFDAQILLIPLEFHR